MRLRPFDIGCEPSPSVPAETLIANGWQTFILFHAVSKTSAASGNLTSLGVAVIECIDCLSSRFGYPNDEGRPEHPLFQLGLVEVESSILEVTDSEWTSEIAAQTAASAVRIWGKSWQPRPEQLRHFVILLKEATFECIAKDLVVRRFFNAFDEALTYVNGKLKEH